ncbi:Glycogen debranching enzyme [Planctomycetes bacterium K2D]|uniref:Glycogen debranching enzyme n=2 Tax=Botrimarina mediterranea TaxID=2528022 RepID=A0A518K4G0_9BACT|nr:glycogen debranching protein GlgX [Botrimarina mediterranea]QDV72667.1 Glycogen debranching enzyme [Botrimarina mediterranea]QDV77239.1 Glycogen debranching enzyme [Planctomycetes bacterium K2D]
MIANGATSYLARQSGLVMAKPHKTLPPMQFSYPLPYGAILREDGVQFVVYSRSATAMRVLLYKEVGDPDPSRLIELNPDTDRWGDLWSVFVPGLKSGQLYHFQADGPFQPERGHRFDPHARLIDPFAKALAGKFLPSHDGIVRPPKCVVIDDHFDWGGDRHLRRPLAESVIYEMHVRGFTQSPTSASDRSGTYLGVIDKIPYLKSLGVTAVELMPVHEYPTEESDGSKGHRKNYWGYDPMAFFAPHRGYQHGSEPGGQVREFKQMVRELHAAGIEVILDVVFNHTSEGNDHGPTFSFKGLENSVYYMLTADGSYKNYSGCGNTVNSNHPIVREMIFNCLRHWVYNYHVDGFRFDLASILSRNRNGDIVPNPPLVEYIAEDPMLSDTKIIAEAWDAAGAYQVGSFASSRWAEWNGAYRDNVRRYWRGDLGMTGPMATRLAGSSDLYQASGRQPYHSINFVTSHDGYTLNDLVSYERKHNLANGEDNRDGDNNNYAANYGVEGPTRRLPIRKLRRRQAKNFIATLMLSQGVPMIVSGDEVLRTQRGNNNAYCQDNAISWFDWRLVDRNADMLRFTQQLIALRLHQPVLRRADFLTGAPHKPGDLPDVAWYGVGGAPIDWHQTFHSLSCVLSPTGLKNEQARHVLVFMHSGGQPQEFRVPKTVLGLNWRLAIDTAAESPNDAFAETVGPQLDTSAPVVLDHHSLKCYIEA